MTTESCESVLLNPTDDTLNDAEPMQYKQILKEPVTRKKRGKVIIYIVFILWKKNYLSFIYSNEFIIYTFEFESALIQPNIGHYDTSILGKEQSGFRKHGPASDSLVCRTQKYCI
ncbi:hypothetical protein BpHYR1_005960 [Brachionus plicatilis]|uniref:Uncharacterized protein n=1 Tax=Brachionus plicatilis TaxID=10195 RepID=A0A3M7PLM4_BRAPC|nr:hypothetical protein BpHYR1_005960 [Brachionus plicatilis]